MNRPQNNGLVEFMDEKRVDDKAWNCMDFWLFSGDEEDRSWEASHARFIAARSGKCPYKDKCPRYKRTIEKRGGIQLNLF